MSSAAQVCIPVGHEAGTQLFAQALSQNREATRATFRSEQKNTHDTARRRSDKQWRGSELTAQTLPSPVSTFFQAPLNAATGSSDPLSLLDLVFHTGFEERLLLGLLTARRASVSPHPFPSPTSCDPKLLARLCVLGARAAHSSGSVCGP